VLDILVDPKMLEIFWNEYGFLKWSDLGFQGVSRRVTFRKNSLMGEVARYYSDDYIIHAPDPSFAARQIMDRWKPFDDVMSHRILMMSEASWGDPVQKSFLFGFRGWVEVIAYRPGDPAPVKKFADLAALVNNAGVVHGKLQEGINPVRERVTGPRKRGVVEGRPSRPAPLDVIKNLFRR